MNVASVISSELRSRASFLPYCPLCSFVSIPEQPDILHGPSHRESRLKKDGAEVIRFKLTQCCTLSANMPPMESKADVAKWWRAKRLESLPDLATNNRRLNCLSKLAAKNLEPIV